MALVTTNREQDAMQETKNWSQQWNQNDFHKCEVSRHSIPFDNVL